MRNTLGLLITGCTIRTSGTLLHSKFRGDVLWCQTEILRSFHVRWRQNKSGLWSSINLKQIKIQDNSHNSDNRSGWNFIPCSVIIFFLSLLLIVNIPSLAFRPQMHYIALVNFIGVLLNRAFRLQALLTLRSKLPAKIPDRMPSVLDLQVQFSLDWVVMGSPPLRQCILLLPRNRSTQ